MQAAADSHNHITSGILPEPKRLLDNPATLDTTDNLLNSHAVQDRYEIGDIDVSMDPHPNFGLPRLYQSPRSVRLGMDIAF